MKMRFDWKFWISLIVTILSVIVPVWLWQTDLTARSFHLKKLSQTSLQLPVTAKAFDLKISVEDSELPNPYLTVFELINNGAKPIPSADFESSIEIAANNKARIVRTSINATNPQDLTPVISVESNLMSIKPMLFNPGDSVTFAVLTTGEEPNFVLRARIAGVQSIPIVDAQPNPGTSLQFRLLMICGALISLVALSLTMGGWPSGETRLRSRAAFLVFIVADSAAAISIIFGLESFGITGYLPVFAVFGVGLFVAKFIAKWLNKQKVATVSLNEDTAQSNSAS